MKIEAVFALLSAATLSFACDKKEASDESASAAESAVLEEPETPAPPKEATLPEDPCAILAESFVKPGLLTDVPTKLEAGEGKVPFDFPNGTAAVGCGLQAADNNRTLLFATVALGATEDAESRVKKLGALDADRLFESGSGFVGGKPEGETMTFRNVNVTAYNEHYGLVLRLMLMEEDNALTIQQIEELSRNVLAAAKAGSN